MHCHTGPAGQSVLVVIGGKAVDGGIEVRIVTPHRISAVTGAGGHDEIGIEGADAGIGGRRFGGTIFGRSDDLRFKGRKPFQAQDQSRQDNKDRVPCIYF
jgi:hypothetical protein